jgi:prepilin-type N-terminal cleavage/methylation domain-containing protein
MECCKNKTIFIINEKWQGFTFVELLLSLMVISIVLIFFGLPLLAELQNVRLDETVKNAKLISNASEFHRKSVSQVFYEVPKSDSLKSIYRGGFVFHSKYRDLSSNVLDWNNSKVFSLSYLYNTDFPTNSFLEDKSEIHLQQADFFSVVYFDAASKAEGLDRYEQALKDSVHDPKSKMLMVPSQYTKSPYLIDISQQYIYKVHSHWQAFRL